MRRECESCVKRKTKYCPTSMKCMATDDVPYYQNRFMLLYENKKYKDNWNKLKEYLTNRYNNGTASISYRDIFIEIQDKMKELEEGSGSNE